MKKFNLELKVTPYKKGLKKDAIPYKYAAIPQGMYMLRNYLNKNEYAIMEFLFTMHDLKSGNKPKEFIKSRIIDHMMIDKDNFNKSIKLLKEKEFIFELESKLIINVDLIIQKINEYGFDWKKLNDPTKEAIQLEADLRVYNTLKKLIDNGVADDEDKAEFAILSNKLGYSNNNDLENNFNNTKTEDYVTTIRTDSNTINTSDDYIDNHISSNEEETEEDLYFQYGEDGFGEDRDDDMQEKINQIKNAELRIEDLERIRSNFNELSDYKVPVNELDVEEEEVKTTQPIHKPVENNVENNKEFGDDAFDLTQFDGIF